MYNLPYFKADDQQQVLDFMHNNPFVTLTGCDADNKPVATHVPLLIKEIDGKMYLQGHIMRQSDHHQAFEQNPNVLAIFTGPHAYISASWYTDQKQASTWNYLTVHARGTLTFGDQQLLLDVLHETTAKFENNPASPSLVEHLPENYVQRLTGAIIAFEIKVSHIDHVFKLSQNKDDKSYKNIISKLSSGKDDAKQIADLMHANRSTHV